jgi:hypothetical protein
MKRAQIFKLVATILIIYGNKYCIYKQLKLKDCRFFSAVYQCVRISVLYKEYQLRLQRIGMLVKVSPPNNAGKQHRRAWMGDHMW